MKQRHARQRGQGLVEFALALPIFLALVMGIVDGCRLLFTYNALQDAARVGARWAIVEVNRDGYFGKFADPGNRPGTYDAPVSASDLYTTTVSNGKQPTITGKTLSTLVGVDRTQVQVTITDLRPCNLAQAPLEVGFARSLAGCPITVSTRYTFRPIVTLGLFSLPLEGRSTQYHA